jgi:CDP-glucose 4,6-dehydratase
MGINSDFWAGRSVLVTGHTGFKGAWLSLWLQHLRAKTTGYSLKPPTTPSLFELADVGSGMTSVIGDIRDFDLLNKVITEARPEIVIHMAAQSLVRYSYTQPIETYGTNVLCTFHLLDSVSHTPGVRAVLNITSDKCYENRESGRPYREDDRLGGHDPYSSSKACAELVTAAYRQSFVLPLATARAGNVVGGGDWAQDRLIPDFVRAIEAGRDVVIRNPAATRPWQHVLEPLSGYLILCEALYNNPSSFSEAWNFGPGEDNGQTVASIAEKLAALSGNRVRYSVDKATADLHEAQNLILDSSKARERLNWRIRLSTDRTLETTMAWYNSYFSGKRDMRELSLAQIDEYEYLPVL